MLYTDSTHLKANANKGKYALALVAKSRADYWADLGQAVEADRAAHDKAPLKPDERQTEPVQTKISRTDPDAGYMVREGKPRASSISIIARWMAGSGSLPTPMPPRPMCMTPSFICRAWTVSASALASQSERSDSMPAMPLPGLREALKNGRSWA